MNFPQYTDYRPGQDAQRNPAATDPSPASSPSSQWVPATDLARRSPSALPNLHTSGDVRLLGGLAHVSSFMFGIFGPLVFWAVSRNGSLIRREAAKSFNFSIIMTIVGGIGIMLDLPQLTAAAAIAWFVLSIIGTVHAFRGEDWDNPVSRVTPWVPLDAGRAVGQKTLGGRRGHDV